MEKVVDSVENIGFPTGIPVFSPAKPVVDKAVDNVDNFCFLHIPALITSPQRNREPPRKRGFQVDFCRLFGEVEGRSEPPPADNLCEKSPKPPPLLLFPPDVSISPFGKYCGGTDQKQEDVIMQGKVEICGINTSRLGLLTQDQMDELLHKSRRGDMDARNKLIEGNLRLVLSVIQRFDKRGESPDDLFQVGCVGLLKAITNFDPDKNVRFSTYGVPMIAGEIRRYLRDNSAIRVSRSLRDVAYRVLQCREAQTLKLGREPSLDEISAELQLPVGDISAALDAICAPVSLFDPVFTDGGDPLTVMDQVRDTKNTEGAWLEKITLREGFLRLSDREKQILSLRFYDGKTQMDVAKTMNISQAQVSRLEKGAICELRKYVSVQIS